MIAVAFVAGLLPGVAVGFFGGRRLRLAYREVNDWLGEWAEARKGADLKADLRVISGEHPVVEAPAMYNQDADSGILCAWCPNEATGTVPHHRGSDDPNLRLPVCDACAAETDDQPLVDQMGPDIAEGLRP